MFTVPVAAGVALLFLAMSARKPPTQASPEERATPVRVMELKAQEFTPTVRGYGTVAPERTWRAVAQVSGRIAHLEPNLKKGAILRKGTEVIKISPRDYELAVAEAEANLEAAKAQLAELKVKEKNAKGSRDIENRSLKLKEADLQRKQQLAARKTVSQLTVEQAENAVLSQQARLQDIENTLRLSPVQIDAQERQIDVLEAKLETAKLNLERTRIALPFDARIAEVNVETTQFVNAGTELATADGIDVAEVSAQIPFSAFRKFAGIAVPENFSPPAITDNETVRRFIEKLGWTAKVLITQDGRGLSWPAKLVRTSDSLDPKTRTVGAIVAVEDAYKRARVGQRPPLVKGTFVEVILSGKPLRDSIVVPRSVVHQGQVYVVTPDSRLEIRPVKVSLEQGEAALISEGLKPGERIVLSNLAPAVNGMLLRSETGIPQDNVSAKGGDAQRAGDKQ